MTERRQKLTSVTAICAGALACSVSSAQDASDESLSSCVANTAQPWTIQLEPSFWFVSPLGEIALPGSSEPIDMNDLNLDSPRLSPSGELHLRIDDWRLSFRGFSYSLEREATMSKAGSLGAISYAAGDQLESSLRFDGATIEAGYRLLDCGLYEELDGTHRMVVQIDALAGLRLFHLDFESDATRGPGGGGITGPTSINADAYFAAPTIGAKISTEIYRDFTIDLESTMGGYAGSSNERSYSFDILVGFQYRPHQNMGVQIGYRMLAFSLIDGDEASELEWRGAMAGLYGGLVLRF